MDKTCPNLGRQPEIDVIKGLSILCMITCHVFENLTPNAEGLLIDFVYGFVNYACGASSFMFCMGIGISYSSHQKIRDLLYRGFILFTIGIALNLCRSVAPVFLNALTTGAKDFISKDIILIIGSDIMLFAGLAFVLLGILKYFKLSQALIMLIAIVLNVLGSIYSGFESENYFITQFVGHFIGSKAESCFPLFSWFIFVAFGFVYGNMYKKITSKENYYGKILLQCIIVSFIIIYIQKCCDQDILPLFHSFLNLYWINLPDALSSVIYCITLIGLAWIITKKIDFKLMSFISKNINKFYCISWVFIEFFREFCINYFRNKGEDFTIIISVAILIMTYFIIILYNKYLIAYFNIFCTRHKMIIIPLIYLSTLIISYYVLTKFTEFPNMHNGYLNNLKI